MSNFCPHECSLPIANALTDGDEEAAGNTVKYYEVSSTLTSQGSVLQATIASAGFPALGAKVKLKGTTITGLNIPASGVEFFGGLQYAEAPVGNLRFRVPVLKKKLDVRSFNATQFGKSCLQPAIFSNIPAEGQSEDCLNVNIFRPAGTKPALEVPFVIGSASNYDGSKLVAQSIARGTPIIYIGFNFRLGTLGYPIGQEALKERNLNLAQHDMITALEWLHENIASFGGDKAQGKTFPFPRSTSDYSGAIQISDLYFVNGIEKLLAGAILQSGTAGAPPHLERNRTSIPLAKLRLQHPFLASEEEIKANILNPVNPAFQTEWWQPTIDYSPGSLLPDFPSKLYERGRCLSTPSSLFSTLCTWPSVQHSQRPPATQDTPNKISKKTLLSPLLATSLDPVKLNKTIDRLLELYPDIPALGSPFGTGNETFGLPSIYKRTSALQADLTFTFPIRHWMRAAAERNVKSYGYLFSQHNPLEEPALGVPHGAEIPYVFGNTPDPSASGQELKAMMMDYWISFTVSSDPNDGKGVKRPRWPQYTNSNQLIIQLDGGNTTIIKDDFRANQAAYMTANAAVFRR
ncbi:triacylglycerol lipase 3 [Coprinopsis sp. MPI-PUGE-AT-0042]|nr:triacylglycerol lipase 3 [Coprinopsis sp. MPI-PUGE-AT-0042]